MTSVQAKGRKRPINLSMNEDLVAQARQYTPNLSATLEGLLADYVRARERERGARQQSADRCAADWNLLHAKVGSFADDHSTL